MNKLSIPFPSFRQLQGPCAVLLLLATVPAAKAVLTSYSSLEVTVDFSEDGSVNTIDDSGNFAIGSGSIVNGSSNIVHGYGNTIAGSKNSVHGEQNTLGFKFQAERGGEIGRYEGR